MNELETSRNEISRIDAEMAKLFEQRMQAAAGVSKKKKQQGPQPQPKNPPISTSAEP